MHQTLPVLPQSDVEQAISLISTAYTPGIPIEQSRQLQQELYEIQKTPEAWGLVVPFLEYHDPNVQFFGAHTAQVKIVRDWESIPLDDMQTLREVMLEVTGKAISTGRSKVILRKLFVAITSLALKLVPGRPSKWPNWILASITTLSGYGATSETILDFLTIVAEEVGSSDLLASNKAQMQQSLIDAVSLVNQAVTASLTNSNASSGEVHSAFKCLEVWIPMLRGNNLTSLIPLLIGLLSSQAYFIGASDVIQEILTKSSFADGSGTKTLTEPLLEYLSQNSVAILHQNSTIDSQDENSNALCKLLVALGEHSINYFAPRMYAPSTQTFLRLLLSFTALPGWYGVDEEESEMTLSFWYLLQEAIWMVDFSKVSAHSAEEQWNVINELFSELVAVLKRKTTFPDAASLNDWHKDQRDKFQVYRRDVGDTLINAYYVLRDKMLRVCVEELLVKLEADKQPGVWESVEAILLCIMSIQEAVPIEDNQYLKIVFGSQILGRLPTTGHHRVRRTALTLIGAYATWFTTQDQPDFLVGALAYVVQALDNSALCLPAANALKDLCDANRQALAPRIAEFAELHARLPSIPDSEKAKVIQSIASVIQAIPPEDEIQPIEAIMSPVVAKLAEALQSSHTLPEEARAVAVHQLQTLTACAKGLTRFDDFAFGEESWASEADVERMGRARQDPRMIQLRNDIVQAIQNTMSVWSTDVTTCDALSDLFKSITALPADYTLISLDPGPLLELVVAAMQQNVNAVWLSLTSMLVAQLDPPPISPESLISVPSPEAEELVTRMLLPLLQTSLAFLSVRENMQSNTEIVQAFFGCMDMISIHFFKSLFQIPQEGLNALLQCAIDTLSVQERYSLVAACTFMVGLINRIHQTDELKDAGRSFIISRGPSILNAVLCGFIGNAPASTTQNLIELLTLVVNKFPGESRQWLPEVLFSSDFPPSKADNVEKEKFIKLLLSSRAGRKSREAAQQFVLIAKGLEGSSFGYASVAM